MTDNQNDAHRWLKRMWGSEDEIRALNKDRERLLEQGVANYDSKHVPGGSDPNPNESRMIEYSEICAKIDARCLYIAKENLRTLEVIDKVANAQFRALLINYYVNQMASWERVGKEMNYEKSRATELGCQALDAVYPFIPKGEITEDD